jgi:hypothetical protein
MRRKLLPLFGALLLAAIALVGRSPAQQPGAPRADPPPQTQRTDAGSGWQFQITPYLWVARLNSDVGPRPTLPRASVSESFGDVVTNLDGALMIAGEARRENWGLLFDAAYLSLSATGDAPTRLFGGADAEASGYFLTPAAVYRVYDANPLAVDAGVGARYWHLRTELNFSEGLLPAAGVAATKSWIDPLLILRGRVDVGSGFSLLGYGDIGGFDVGSRLTWSLMGLVQYRFNDWIEGALGYRHLYIDYNSDSFIWKGSLSGPILGVRFQF